jgi:hypothetical protein
MVMLLADDVVRVDSIVDDVDDDGSFVVSIVLMLSLLLLVSMALMFDSIESVDRFNQ